MPGNGGCATGVAAAAFDALPEPVWELRGDDLRVVTANRAARTMAPEGVTVSGSCFDSLGAGLDDPDLLTALRHVLRTGEPARDLHWVRPATARAGPTRYRVDADQVRAVDGTVRGVLARARETGSPRSRLRVLDGGHSAGATAPAAPRPPAHMPDRVPVMRGVRMAAHHIEAPAAVRSGEWFDVIALPGGRVALAVGTVGRQEPAVEATAAGALRAVLADCLLGGGGVADAIDRLDAAATRTPALHGATVALALMDTDDGAIEHARCGHLPVVLRGPGATGSREGLPDDGAGGPLGVGAPRPTVRRDVLQPGGLLLLHTGRPHGDSTPVTEWLGSLARGAGELWPPAVRRDARELGDPADSPAAVDVFAARLLDRVGGANAAPGLTLLAVTRPVRESADFRVEVPAVATELAPLRAALTGWLEELGTTAETVTAVPLVVSELASNTIEHAYRPDRPGRVSVSAAVDGPAGLLVTVADDGNWAGGRLRPGYGLAVARELSDTMRVDTDTDSGTRVEVSFAISRPTVVHPSGPRARLRPAVSGAFEVVERPDEPPVVRVHGPLDLSVVDELRSTLLHASGGGARAVVLDVTATTGIAGAGVRLLYELGRFADPPLRVLAPAGSAAHGVLTVAGLGHLLVERG
ncbi:ATP-binding protein [Pseudonocardia humida]|uniref:ATP-binding protein n=1 Tax=Pseudonocardia humida TaxID=2800819 RepID=A0ABT0ZTF5_9PSEU|nr:ATP-binding protein [Pseudonocardia humida]MCO1653994.1 ATP-binding protein [Pseudonocardia humida]